MIILFVIVVLLDFMEEPEVKGHVDVGLGSHDQTGILLNRLSEWHLQEIIIIFFRHVEGHELCDHVIHGANDEEPGKILENVHDFVGGHVLKQDGRSNREVTDGAGEGQEHVEWVLGLHHDCIVGYVVAVQRRSCQKTNNRHVILLVGKVVRVFGGSRGIFRTYITLLFEFLLSCEQELEGYHDLAEADEGSNRIKNDPRLKGSLIFVR